MNTFNLRKLIVSLALSSLCFPVYAGVICTPGVCQEKLIQSGNAQIFARDWGVGSNRNVVLFVHGFPHSDITWENQINSFLATKYRIITMDLRGMGASDKPTTAADYAPNVLANDIKAVLDAFSVKTAFLVGNSYGGAPITYFAYYGNTKRINGIVYANANPSFNDLQSTVVADTGRAVGLTLPNSSGVDPTFADFATGNMQFLSRSYSPSTPVLSDFRDISGQDYLVSPQVRLALLTSEPTSFTPLLRNYAYGLVKVQKIPVLIIYGAADIILDPNALYGFVDMGNNIVGSRSIAYSGIGHFPQLTNSKQFNTDLDTFIQNRQ